MPVSVRLDAAEIRRVLTGPNGPVVQDLTRRALRVQNRAKQLCPVDTGRLRASITVEIRTQGTQPFAIIGTNVEYARWIHDGTGVYGPRGAPIRPRNGQFLRFTPKGSNRVVYARSVRGVRPTPFLLNALPAAAG